MGALQHFMSVPALHHTHMALLHLSPLHTVHTYQLGLEEDGSLNLCWKYTSQHPTTGPESRVLSSQKIPDTSVKQLKMEPTKGHVLTEKSRAYLTRMHIQIKEINCKVGGTGQKWFSLAHLRHCIIYELTATCPSG